MAAELRTANVKRVGKERATFVGYPHPAGMTVSAFTAIYGDKRSLDPDTVKFYEVAADKLEAAEAADLIPANAASVYGARLSSLRKLDTDTWLLAVGEELAGEWLAIGTSPRRFPRAAVVLWSRCARYVFRL
jgi:hypothetical protein